MRFSSFLQSGYMAEQDLHFTIYICFCINLLKLMKYIDNESIDQLNHCLVGLHTFQPTGTLKSVDPSSLTNVRLRSDVGREEGFYLTTHSTHFIYGRKEGNVLFNDALNTFYLRLYGVRFLFMVI